MKENASNIVPLLALPYLATATLINLEQAGRLAAPAARILRCAAVLHPAHIPVRLFPARQAHDPSLASLEALGLIQAEDPRHFGIHELVQQQLRGLPNQAYWIQQASGHVEVFYQDTLGWDTGQRDLLPHVRALIRCHDELIGGPRPMHLERLRQRAEDHLLAHGREAELKYFAAPGTFAHGE